MRGGRRQSGAGTCPGTARPGTWTGVGPGSWPFGAMARPRRSGSARAGGVRSDGLVGRFDVDERHDAVVLAFLRDDDALDHPLLPVDGDELALADDVVGRDAPREIVARDEDVPAQAPWHFLNFLPLPHQHGSLRPILSWSPATTVWTPAADGTAIVTASPAPAAAIAAAPAVVSCSYCIRPLPRPLPAACGCSSAGASSGASSAWNRCSTTSSRIARPNSRNILCPSPVYSTSGSFCAMPRRWMPSRR